MSEKSQHFDGLLLWKMQLFLGHYSSSTFEFKIITDLVSLSLELENDSLRLCLF